MSVADLALVQEKVGASVGHSETASPSTERFGARHRDPYGIWLVTITAAMLTAVFITAWLLTSLGGNTAATIAAAAVSVVAFLAVVAAIRELADARTFRMLCSLIVTVVACLAIVGASWTGALLRLKVQSSEAAWTHAALCALGNAEHARYSGSGSCAGVQSGRLNLPNLGRVEQISIYPPAVVFRGPNNTTGLIYSPSPGSGQVGCVGHINGPWWQYGGSDAGCPLGMHYTGP